MNVWDTVDYATRHFHFPYTQLQVTSGTFNGIRRESIAYSSIYPIPQYSETLGKFSEELGNRWEF